MRFDSLVVGHFFRQPWMDGVNSSVPVTAVNSKSVIIDNLAMIPYLNSHTETEAGFGGRVKRDVLGG